MSFKTGLSIDNNNLKFVELRKYLITNDSNCINSINCINCLAIDNSQQLVFVANNNKLIVISINHLLNFVWNKSVINEIIDKFEHFSIELNLKSHLISISAKGFGTKLAVCGTVDQNNSPLITFYDLSSVYKTQNNSTPYSRINLINSNGLVSEICWHPEIADNQFGCCLTDGSIYIVSIGDVESKTTTILSYMPSTSNAISLCWSPKGKQLVIGFRNASFSQYKLNGQQLQEVKRTTLPNNLSDYSVISIKWIVSSLFAIACTKHINESEKDTHIILVSTPSKGSPQFVDFGAICLDNYEVNDYYRINLLHFENMILCSTSLSSEVAVIGCDPSKDISSPDNWSQWMLDDSSRIDLPMDSEGNDTYLRGIAISKGTPNTFQVNANEVYGGVGSPLLMVYNSSGILLPFLIIEKSGNIKCPEPPNIVKPTATASTVSQPLANTSTPIQSHPFNAQQTALTSKPSSIPSFGSPFTPITSSALIPSKPTSKPIPQPTQVMPTQPTSKPNIESFTAQQYASRDIPSTTTNTNLVVSVNQKQTRIASQIDNNESQIPSVSPNDIYLDALTEQISEFNKVMIATKHKFSQIKANIGEKEEQLTIRANSRRIEDVLNEIKVNFKECTKDTTTLQACLIESFSLLEEANSIVDRNLDPKYRFLLKQRSLDPITARRMDEIHSLNEYIQIQLRELDAKFEQEWNEWLEKRKHNKTAQSIVRFKNNTNCELVYKSLANNQKVIHFLRLQLQKLEGIASPLKIKNNLIKEQINKGSNKKDIERLAQSLKDSSIRDLSDDSLNERIFKLKTVSKEKKIHLKEFLENRPNVPIRRSVDIINSNSSRFISAIEKLKQKQRDAKTDCKLNSEISSKSNDNKTSSPIAQQIVVKENIVKTQLDKPITVPIQKLDLTLPSPSFSLASNTNSTIFSNLTPTSSKSNITKTSDNSQITPKPLAMPTFSAENTPTNSSQKTTSVSSTKTKSNTDLTNKDETDVELTSMSSTASISKTVSFGNTTIINPIESTADNNFKLDTITECTENNENVSSSGSPFTSFQGFGGNVSNKDSVLPKLSFNLSKTTTGLFSLEGDSENKEMDEKSKSSLPKYEDISPPSTPQSMYSELQNTTSDLTTLTETESSKPLSILKTTLSAKPLNQNTETKSQTSKDNIIINPIIAKGSDSQSITTNVSKSDSGLKVISEVPIITSSMATNTSISTTTSSMPSFTTQTTLESVNDKILTSSPLFGSQPQLSQKSEPTSSPFSQSGFGQTPFASNSFSFGNVAPNTTSNTPNTPTSFGQGLSFGGSTGFDQTIAVSKATTNASTGGSLSFGQQTSAINNLSFCGLGGRPTPENANKNVFGGNFAAVSPQTSQFPATSQSSPFTVKPSSGGAFSGSFSSGSGVAQTGFGAFQQSSQQPASIFGGSPVFGGPQQPAFGGSPTFGGGSPPQSAFGSSPTFGGAPVMGSLNAFSNPQTNTGFGGSGFTNTSNSSLSFGAIASSAQQTQQTPFGGQFSFNSPSNSFGTTEQSQSFSFTQRRK